MARLSISFLGPARVTVDGKPCPLTPRLLGLLAYVAVEGGRPHRRESLAALFWPEKPNPVALSNLRSALRDLRAALGEQHAATPLFMTTSSEVQLHERANLWLDVAAFNSLLLARRGAVPDLDRLQQATALYLGSFLEGLSLSGSTDWEEWLLIKREALQRQMLEALRTLAVGHEERCEYERAIAYARQAVELEPWQEEAHRQLMRLLAICGQRSAAIFQYRRCEQVMLRDLGAQLGPETIALYERIRDGALVAPLHRPDYADDAEPAGHVFSYTRRPASSQPLAPLDGFDPPKLVGRQAEFARLESHLAQALAGQGRVVLVTGEAGSGKTALVEAFCRQAMDAYPGLLVALSRCSARQGAGDPYQPFREIIAMLALGPGGEPLAAKGRVQGAPLTLAHLASGALSSEHARRLEAAQPAALAALAQEGADLVRLVAHGPALLSCAEASAPAGAAWLARLEALVVQAKESTALGQQAAVHHQATGMLRSLARLRPLVLVLDDLQWADGPTLDLLFHLGRHLQESHILVVGTFRPEDDGRPADRSPESRSDAGLPPANARGQLSGDRHPLEALTNEFQRQWGDIRVDLAQAEGQRFIWAYVDTQPNRLGAAFREALLRHTGGNALFTVELVRAMQERGDLQRDAQELWVEGPNLDWESLPPRVEGSIAQRIGQLTEAQRQLLNVASVQGVDFHAEVLARVMGEPEAMVMAALGNELNRERHLVEVRGIERIDAQHPAGGPATLPALPPRQASLASPTGISLASRYRFRHELFQTYLYSRLDPVRRAHLHGAVGAAIEELYGQRAMQLAWQLARHWESAGEAARAARYLLEAGRQAARVGAHREAIDAYQRALALMVALPDSVEHTELELALQLALDDSLLATHGWGAPERLRTSGRAYELGQRLNNASPYRMHALRSLADLSVGRGELKRAIELATELLAAAERVPAPQHIAAAHTILAHGLAMQGELSQAWEHARQALAIGPAASRDLDAGDARPQRPYAEMAACYVQLARGRPDQARRQLDQVMAPQVAGAQHVTAYTQALAAMFYAIGHDQRSARRWAEEALRTIEGGDTPEAQAWAERALGWAEARVGDAQRGMARLMATIRPQPGGGTVTYRYIHLALLAETYLAADKSEAARQTAEQALASIEETGVRFYEAELWRLRGEALLRGARTTGVSAPQEAEAYFTRAIEVARRQGARLWELRATVSLAHLWVHEGRPREAQQALTAIYATFNEGFDTPDLVEARTLLDDLRADSPGQAVPGDGRDGADPGARADALTPTRRRPGLAARPGGSAR